MPRIAMCQEAQVPRCLHVPVRRKRQIELVSAFADQAVIAIPNTHLFEAEQASQRELQESLEYQTAMSNVLAVISRSPNELRPVLDAIVETAARLCEAERAAIWRLINDQFQFVAATGNSPEFIVQMRRNPPPTGRQSMNTAGIFPRSVGS
jgi:hypothetical protein